MENYKITRIHEHKKLKDAAANWFHKKWGIPLNAYQESIEESIKNETAVPQWYIAVSDDKIIGGLGIIENDFHNRKDLTPNICALYVEEDFRCNGIAGRLLNTACKDMQEKGINTLYLVTDHTSFYERYGWEFLCMVQCDGETEMSRMYIHKI
ncbi:MAG: GNAT family N-acetyltransferase [Lachnospiraceae bacterium]